MVMDVPYLLAIQLDFLPGILQSDLPKEQVS